MGAIIIISGPSGSGKTTVSRFLEKRHPKLHSSISVTTRKPRKDEKQDQDYYFISEDEFDRYIEDGLLAEWEEVHGNRYGTLKKQVEAAINSPDGGLLLDIDPKGGLSLKKIYPDSILIFLKTESSETLIDRLKSRKTESKEAIEKRMRRVSEEYSLADKYDYIILNNNLEETVDSISRIIEPYIHNAV